MCTGSAALLLLLLHGSPCVQCKHVLVFVHVSTADGRARGFNLPPSRENSGVFVCDFLCTSRTAGVFKVSQNDVFFMTQQRNVRTCKLHFYDI